MSVDVGTLGVWSGELRFLRDRGAAREAASAVDELGYGAIWLPGSTAGKGQPIYEIVGEILDATHTTTVATGIVSIWAETAEATAAAQVQLRERHPGRFLLGLGSSHVQLVSEEEKELLRKPRTAMIRYLDAIDAAQDADTSGERILAALGPKMLELARDRALGSHPYFVTPAHTAVAREALGPDALLAPEQAVVLETDPDKARAIGRKFMSVYLGLPNYTNNLLRHGFDESDLLDGGSDRLVDAVAAWGDEAAIAARVAEHRAAGADHVALQVLHDHPGTPPLDEWRRIAAALL